MLTTTPAAIGFDGWRALENQLLEKPGLTLEQARTERARTLALHALLEDLVARDVLDRRREHALRIEPSLGPTSRRKAG